MLHSSTTSEVQSGPDTDEEAWFRPESMDKEQSVNQMLAKIYWQE